MLSLVSGEVCACLYLHVGCMGGCYWISY